LKKETQKKHKMTALLIYLIKSTICISLFYLVFRWTLKKENLFSINRIVLIAILVLSVAIPLIKAPVLYHQAIKVEAFPNVNLFEMPKLDDVAMQITTTAESNSPTSTEKKISFEQVSATIYLAGLLIILLGMITGLVKLFLLLFQTKIYRRKNYRLALVNHSISPMSFGHFIIMSKQDYRESKNEILNHEMGHIKFRHTYDLLLVELVKLFHWFNPLVYRLRNDLKEIQEFQVDRHLLDSGIDSHKYQLLLIEKCVGAERYALANSFNHCQIKNRITMMNNQKNRKSNSWKVAIFLPVAALMLMAFGKPGDLISSKIQTSDIKKNWTESDFGKPNYADHEYLGRSIHINSNFEVVVNGKINDWDEVSKQIWECMDYNSTTTNLKKGFEKTVIDGKEVMVQNYIELTVWKDISTPDDIYQNFLNFIGGEVLKIRQKYANEIYKNSYDQLTQNQKNSIDKVVPAIISVQKMPAINSDFQKSDRPSLNIEVRAEGIYILPDKKVLSLQEMKEKVKEFADKPDHWMVDVKIAVGLNNEKVNSIKVALQEFKTLNVRYLTFDPVYTMAEKMAVYPGGEFALRKFLDENIKYPEEAVALGISGKVYIGFIVNSKGKVVFPKVVRGLSPELDKEAIKIVSQFPTWQPAIQNGTPVSMSYTVPIEFAFK